MVSEAEGAALAREISQMLSGRAVPYLECSSKTGRGVEQAVFALCSAAMHPRADRAAAGLDFTGTRPVRPQGTLDYRGTRGHGPDGRGMKCCVQ